MIDDIKTVINFGIVMAGFVPVCRPPVTPGPLPVVQHERGAEKS
jgi:hypothetical protein